MTWHPWEVASLFEAEEDRLVTEPLIRSIQVVGLFGRYSYRLDRPDLDGLPGRLMLLHGNNVSGKTTLLKLAWHLLSHADNRGHRSALARYSFRRLRVDLAGDRTIEVNKLDDQLQGAYTIDVSRPDGDPIRALYSVDQRFTVVPNASTRRVIRYSDRKSVILDLNDRVTPGSAEEDYLDRQAEVLQFIVSLGRSPMMLADDRSMHSDDIEPDAERESRITERLTATEVWQRLIIDELTMSMRRLNDWLRELTLGGQTVGSESSNSIYSNVLTALARGDAGHSGSDEAVVARLLETLDEVRAESPRFAEFGLVPALDWDEFRNLLQSVSPSSRAVAANIVSPYLESQRARYNALRSAERLIRLLLGHANSYLEDKYVTFNPRQGLRVVVDPSGEGERTLGPDELSSGERQLMLLLSSTIMAAVNGRLFIIDEPELSLGVPWQRRILDSLLACTSDSSLQFIVATHSIEMITANRDSLVRLERPE